MKHATPFLLAAIAAVACLSLGTEAFAPTSVVSAFRARVSSTVVVRESNGSDSEEESPPEPAEKMSLEEKMKSWEATDEELRAASLGGVIPQPRERTEAFDVGLYIAFPIMVITGLAFAVFPFIMGNIDVSDIEVPRQ
ncbi:unnamed protein product [Pseudo-nitzschia multistriata]|uniref:Uncharacterized protein n=1 Tax=Pseudo-nitzschia multistriata TaxID=183589 RepID=A0A448Z7Q8_9STRA|nr:unnamed protein product [Pseudo-nitzschia multistriata]